jgi:hypothetical protein
MRRRCALPIFALSIFLSALLLFLLEPMVARMVLPVLGGAPATWAVSLCFYQALLLFGYAYAHALGAGTKGPTALALHLTVLGLAGCLLPIALPPLLEPPHGNTYLWLLGVLAAMAALPFFALSASAPLLQAWFAGVGHPRSNDPYFLYAASNAGSLAALLAYPFLIEPLLPLTLQSRAWAAGFAVLALLLLGCGLLTLAAPPRTKSPPQPASPTRWRERAHWAFLAFVPSGLLVAFTTYLTTDLASAPLLWVVPLALFLLTFLVVFRDRALISPRLLMALQPLSMAGVLVANEWTGELSWALAAALGLLAFLITSLLAHGQLYARRPGAGALTSFYLWMSLGGVLGGAFAALAAPQLYTNVGEFPLLLGLGMLCRPTWRAPIASRRQQILFLLLVVFACAGVLLFAHVASGLFADRHSVRLPVLAVLGLALIAARRSPQAELALSAALLVGVAWLPFASTPVYATRTFFGTHRVVDTAGGAFRLLLHGTTLHGVEKKGGEGRPIPLGYYHPAGPIARSIGLARIAAGGPATPLRIGIVGLGTGALSCYSLPGDRWRFFEIDPAVVRIATNAAYFRYWSACAEGAEIVLGDARLTLAREGAGAFDLLVLDAFSSDAVPIHLLTLEAFRLYASLLAPRGILTLHISNQNVDLPPVIEANLTQLPQLTGVYAEGERGPGALASQVVLVAQQGELLDPALTFPKARRLGATTVRPWSDDYSDILSAMLRRYGSKLGLSSRP